MNGFRSPSEKGTVVVAGDLPAGILRSLNELDEFTIIHCRTTMAESVSFSQRLSPCVLLVPQGFFQTLNSADTPVAHSSMVEILVVSDVDPDSLYEQFLNLRCSGYVTSEADSTVLRRAIQAVRTGELWMPRRVLSRIVRDLALQRSRRLTPREREILQLIGQGHNNRKIAEALFISRETVRWHVRSLYSKIGVHDRRQVSALQEGASDLAESSTWQE